MTDEIFDDLAAEQDRLEAVLSGLPAAAWSRPSAAEGWTVADVVLHLAQTEEAVVASATGAGQATDWRRFADGVDEAMAAMVRTERGTPDQAFDRWRTARRAALAALRRAEGPLTWVTDPLKPRTLATTRLAEHWAHALDITAPLGIDYPDTARLRHIAWLGHSSLPYAFALAGQQPAPEVYVELTAPDGSRWQFGPERAGSSITGPAGAFCRVGAQRLAPQDSGLATTGPYGAAALRVLRNYAS